MMTGEKGAIKDLGLFAQGEEMFLEEAEIEVGAVGEAIILLVGKDMIGVGLDQDAGAEADRGLDPLDEEGIQVRDLGDHTQEAEQDQDLEAEVGVDPEAEADQELDQDQGAEVEVNEDITDLAKMLCLVLSPLEL